MKTTVNCNCIKCLLIPMHAKPLPVNPSLHSHSNDPSVLIHTALMSHTPDSVPVTFCLHSSMAARRSLSKLKFIIKNKIVVQLFNNDLIIQN